MLDFFQTASRNLAAAAKRRGIEHHVALSVVGADRLPDSGYLRAKVAQEEAVKAAGVPYTIVRATQFFEFIGRIADSGFDGETMRLPLRHLFSAEPGSAEDVAATLADDRAEHEPAERHRRAGRTGAVPLDERRPPRPCARTTTHAR